MITLVLYFGPGHWKAPKDLHSRLKMPEEAQRKKEEGEAIMKNWILDEAEDRGIEKGQRQAWAKSIRHMRLTRNMTEEEAFDMLNVPQEERNKIKELLDN